MSKKKAQTESFEDYGVADLVPDKARHYSFFGMFSTWAGANCQPQTWFIGGTLAATGLGIAISVNLLTVPILFVIVALIGYIGFKYPTTTMGVARFSFGIRGSRVLSLFHVIAQFGWAGVNAYLGAVSLSYMFNTLFGWPAAGMEGDTWVLALGDSNLFWIDSIDRIFWRVSFHKKSRKDWFSYVVGSKFMDRLCGLQELLDTGHLELETHRRCIYELW